MVPSRSGPEGSDPNTVAGYVDNDLDAEQVGEYEKKCLSSDVNLAEVSCVHQILSLLGQKVQVPVESKARMYQLVRGRESTPTPRRDGVKPAVRVPVTEPIQPWVAPAPPPRHWLERFGPLAGCLALVGLLCWSAYQSLTPPTSLATPPGEVPQPVTVATVPSGENSSEPDAAKPQSGMELPEGDRATAGEAHAADAREATVAAKATEHEANPGVEAAPKTEDNVAKAKNEMATPAVRAVPAGSVGVVDKVNGILLRFSTDKREWERIAEGTSLNSSDRLLCLEPFRARIVVAKTPITLIGETQVLVTSKTGEEPPAFELTDGRVLIDKSGSPPSRTLKIGFAGLGAFDRRAVSRLAGA